VQDKYEIITDVEELKKTNKTKPVSVNERPEITDNLQIKLQYTAICKVQN
jgi:hypothetical protein